MNLIAIVGNAATDPELRQTPTGRSVATFRIAVSRPGGEQADFFTVVAWERTAEIVKEYLAKGRRVAIEGRLHHSSWKAEDGSKQSKVEIVASRVHLLNGRPTTDAATPDSEDAPQEAVAV